MLQNDLNIIRPNFSGVAGDVVAVTPTDDLTTPNVPDRTFGLYVGRTGGYVNFVAKGTAQVYQPGAASPVELINPGGVPWPVYLMLNGVQTPVIWQHTTPPPVRPFLHPGGYMLAEVVHVLQRDTSVPLGDIFALVT